MKVLHSGTLAVSAGGPAMSTYLTLKGLRQLGLDAQLIMGTLKEGDNMRGDDVPIHYVKSNPMTPLGFAPSFKRDVLGLGDYDIYHAQGVWQWNTYALASAARQCGKPYLITPRGMLYPQDIKKSNAFLKKLSLKLRLLNDLNEAACVHVTCEEEMKHCRDLGIVSPIAVIPNPVEIKDYPYQKEDGVRRIGYLGRVSRRKNIEGLIEAFHELGSEAEDAELLIIGGGDKDYERELHGLVTKYHLTNVRFTGFLTGEEKDKALASCSVLTIPSEFENLGNVVLEGLVRGIPCIATTGSPWKELQTHYCGWWIPYTQADITNAVRSALNATEEELQTMGQNGRKLMEERYRMEAIAEKMKSLYEWILGSGEKPDFVYF
ncbi:MAG: glycosyltransferase [Prevotella sp.]|nr:glycosyltransferase [Prevotella sp.]